MIKFKRSNKKRICDENTAEIIALRNLSDEDLVSAMTDIYSLIELYGNLPTKMQGKVVDEAIARYKKKNFIIKEE